MRIALIWAMARNGVIGKDNSMPWYLPEDLKYFKRVTTGKPVIMGRKTYDSIGRPLPNRTNIVVTRNASLALDGVSVVTSFADALELAQAESRISEVGEVIVMGGAEIYAQALPLADRLYVTLIHAEVEGDAVFPPVDLTAYKELAREDVQASAHNPFDYSFVVYERPKPELAISL